MLKNLSQLFQAEAENLVKVRRQLHQQPELSMEEFETTKFVAKELAALGIEYKLGEATGVIGTIYGGQPGKTVLLRGDMDALPVPELNEG